MLRGNPTEYRCHFGSSSLRFYPLSLILSSLACELLLPMRSAVLTIVGALVQTVVREEVGADAGLASSLYDRSPSVCWIEDGMHIYYTEDADGKRALTTAADPAGTVAAGGVFIRRVYATSNCGPCQVQRAQTCIQLVKFL